MKKLALLFLLLTSSYPLAWAESTYPNQVRIAFLDACVGLNKELIAPCKCTFDGLQKHIPYKEFRSIVQSKAPMQNRKVKAISQQCAFKASAKQR